jgi:hypothetical protein
LDLVAGVGLALGRAGLFELCVEILIVERVLRGSTTGFRVADRASLLFFMTHT